MPPEARIPLELAEFLESGLSVVLATRDGDRNPDGAVAWAVLVDEDCARLTVFLHDTAAAEMLHNLKSHPEIAIALDLPTSHRACQLKGVYLSHRAATPDEREIVERQIDAFARDLEALGFPRVMTYGWTIWPCTALEVQVKELFEQTPGPGTGGPLTGTGGPRSATGGPLQ